MVERLKSLWMNFTRNYGPLLGVKARKTLSKDAMYLNCHCVETLEPKTKAPLPGPIFNPSFSLSLKEAPKAGTVADAIWISLNLDGELRMERLLTALDISQEEIEAKFINENLAYKDPSDGKWKTADEYLSGDVKTKLEMAKLAAEENGEFARNLEKLIEMQPQPIGKNGISAMPSSPWIPGKYMVAYLAEITDNTTWKAVHADKAGKWIVECGFCHKNAKVTSIYGTMAMGSHEIFESLMNGKTITIKNYDYVEKKDVLDKEATLLARTKAEEMESHFMKWIWSDVERTEDLESIYNKKFNRFVERKWKCGRLTLPGMSKEWLERIEAPNRKYQPEAIFRGIHGGNLLLAHTVGAGKTIETIAIIMEMKRLRLIRKALIAVPNNKTEDWAQDWKGAYPAAKLLIIDRESLDKESRQRMYALAATGDFDAIIMAHSTFSKLGVRADTEAAYMKEQIAEMESSIAAMNSEGMGKFIKRAEKQKAALAERLEKLTDQKGTDASMAYEDIGCDLLAVDEAHNFKGIPFTSSRQNIPGIQVSPSKRGALLDMKARYTCGTIHNWRRGVMFLTGTPISNSISEVYVMLRYLGLKSLREAGLEHFDSWAGMFGRTVTEIEVTPTGTGFRTHTRFSSFHNLPELKYMFRRFTDVILPDDLDLDIPKMEGGAPIGVECEISETQKEYIDDLVARAERLKSSPPDPSVDNMLKVCTDARKVALDGRLVGLDEASGNRKTARCAKNIAKIYHENPGTTQCVFCDLGVPTSEGVKGDKFNIYDDLRMELERLKVKPEEIAYIHDAKTDAEKSSLFANVREGNIRIVIGNTQRMGEGTNFQQRMIAIHHLDCPWKPAHYDQRNGRVFRSGNKNKKAWTYIYITKESFDAYMWQTVERKSKAIASFMSHNMSIRELEGDTMTLTAAEMKALASGSPMVQERTMKTIELQKLQTQKHTLLNSEKEARWTISSVKSGIESASRIIDICAGIAECYKPPQDPEANELHTKYGTMKGDKIGEFIKEMASASVGMDQQIHIGAFAGVALYAKSNFFTKFILASKPNGNAIQLLKIDGNEEPANIIRALKSELTKTSHKKEKAEAERTKLENDLANLNNSETERKIAEIDVKAAQLKLKIDELDKLLEKNAGDSQVGMADRINETEEEGEDGDSGHHEIEAA